MEYTYDIKSPVGILTVAGDGENLSGLWIAGQTFFAKTLEKNAVKQNLPLFGDVRKWLDIYFSGGEPGFMPPLKPRGTPFQKAIWKLLEKIAYGRTTSYGEIARQYEAEHKRHTSPRAVGGAVGRNPISILIPCHRVTGKNGDLTGYAGGITVKQKLLQMEGINLTPSARILA